MTDRPVPSETLVVAPDAGGFRVYSVARPSECFRVTGTQESAQCTCPEYLKQLGNGPVLPCLHIFAVFPQLAAVANAPAADDGERLAIQAEAQQEGPTPRTNSQPTQMMIKRSVSPDGKIDAVSIEISCVILGRPRHEVVESARRILELQNEIAKGVTRPVAPVPAVALTTTRPSNGPVVAGRDALPAQLLNVGGMDTKWGRRLFIRVQVKDQVLRFFGSPKQLSDAIRASGTNMLGAAAEGVELNLPCRVTLEPSADGRYLNVQQVLPAMSLPNASA